MSRFNEGNKYFITFNGQHLNQWTIRDSSYASD